MSFKSLLPKWIRVIQYQRLSRKIVMFARNAILISSTALVAWPVCDPLSFEIVKSKGDKEHVESARRYYHLGPEVNNFEPGQYYYDSPPIYDMADRRSKYPQYYGDRYDGFRKYEV